MSAIGRFTSIIGAILLVASIILVAKNFYDINILHVAANIQKTKAEIPNPSTQILISFALVFASGFLLGIGGLAGLTRRRNPQVPPK